MRRKNVLKPLGERMTDDQLRHRAAKTEVRAALSLEHAKTRGLANLAFQNTLHLHKQWKQAILGACIALAALISAMSAIGYVLWTR